ncbi:gp436 family protein [Pseudomonas aeruginosa]|uniref:gp436 family protein n=1 Tax=Pseudomonas aeruginosa TaxID=287 RepID=UPI003985492A
MAVYITLPELAERPGAEELSQAATPRPLQAVDSELLDALLRGLPVDRWTPEEIEVGHATVEVINSAVSDAQGYIDGFLQRRGYSLPLAKRYGVVTGWTRAIARYLLHQDRLGPGAEKDPIVRDYRDALKFLQLIAEGKFSLGPDDPLTPPGSGVPQVSAPPRTFSHDTLKDY